MRGRKKAGRRAQAAPKPSFLGRLSEKLPQLLVFACCLLFAVQLGIFQPYFSFEKASCSAAYPGCSASGPTLDGYASGRQALAYLPHSQNFSARFSFSGSGRASGVEIYFGEPGIEIDGIRVDGNAVCGPCGNLTGRAMKLTSPGEGALLLEVSGHETGLGQSLLELPPPPKLSFFDAVYPTHVLAPMQLQVEGGWFASAGSSIPSSFYGEDAPFHMGRIPLLSSYLLRGAWPWSAYDFISMAPAALFYIATGLPHEYAFKLLEIALFFVPIAIFWLFSRRLQRHSSAVFVLSSLAYLFLPSFGYPLGGGADLFFYGMAPYATATYCSLFFFLFAYEFVLGRKGCDGALLVLCAALSALAFAENQRIIFSLGAGFAVIAAAALAAGRLRRAALLLVACAASCGWLAYSFIRDFSFGAYSQLGGASPGSGSVPLALVQIGYAVLPPLSVAGAYVAWRRKELFPLACAAYSVLMLLFATSDSIERLLPFADVLRSLPSFYLPFVFLCGIGAAASLGWLAKRSGALAGRLALDRETLVGVLMLAVIAPVGFLMMAAGQATITQYSQKAVSLEAASDYSSFAAARAMIGSERAAFVLRGDVSEYPAFDTGIGKTERLQYADAGGLAAAMRQGRLRYALVGNEVSIAGANGTTAQGIYEGILADPEFERVLDAGTVQVFALKGAPPAPDVYGGDVYLEDSDVSFDSASASGECRADSCTVVVYSQTIPPSAECAGIPAACSLSFDANTSSISVGGISRGRFSFGIGPQRSPTEIALIVAGMIALALCFFFCRGRN